VDKHKCASVSTFLFPSNFILLYPSRKISLTNLKFFFLRHLLVLLDWDLSTLKRNMKEGF
jgi:hypothetical protein